MELYIRVEYSAESAACRPHGTYGACQCDGDCPVGREVLASTDANTGEECTIPHHGTVHECGPRDVRNVGGIFGDTGPYTALYRWEGESL